MKATIWKRLVSMFCCVIILFMTLSTDVEAAERHMTDSDAILLESISDKLEKGLEKNLGYVEIFETFTEEEWAAFRREAEQKSLMYASNGISTIQLNDEQMEEAAYIDSLAKEYYDYYSNKMQKVILQKLTS